MNHLYIEALPTDNPLPLVASHWWGQAALPADTPYPTYKLDDGGENPYTFIAQINLADIATLDPENLLPHQGILSFFGIIDHYLGDYDEEAGVKGTISSPDAVKVIYSTDLSDLHPHILVDDEGHDVAPHAMAMSFAHHREMTDAYHGLLVPPQFREWEDWDAPCAQWVILFQVDSFVGPDFDLNFMDVGVLDFLIDPADLARRDFSHVRAIVLST